MRSTLLSTTSVIWAASGSLTLQKRKCGGNTIESGRCSATARSRNSLILPLMSDPESLATLDVLTKIVPPALFTDANLHAS